MPFFTLKLYNLKSLEQYIHFFYYYRQLFLKVSILFNYGYLVLIQSIFLEGIFDLHSLRMVL
jgi:hypothetical protein